MNKLNPSTVFLLLLLLFFFFFFLAVAADEKFNVGDEQRWATDVNYTAWSGHHRFHVGDWLVFSYKEGVHDVLEVNATAYAFCSAEAPIANWSRGGTFTYRLNRAGRYYFICGRGYCYAGMKLALVAHPPLRLSPPPSPVAISFSAAAASRCCSTVARIVVVVALLWSLR